MSLLSVVELGKHFGGVRAVSNLSFSIERGTIYAVIGPNGAGKTTVFNMISGLYAPSSGQIWLAGQEITPLTPVRRAAMGIARTFQNLQIFAGMTAAENVMVGRHLQVRRGWLESVLHLPGLVASERDCRARALELLEFVGIGQLADAPADGLAYGQLKKLEIARALAGEPKLLLLDEPAAGCNASETQEIVRLIKQVAGEGVTVLLVEHDMQMVMGISDTVLVLDHGEWLAEGPAEEVRHDPAVVEAYLGTQAGRDERVRHASEG